MNNTKKCVQEINNHFTKRGFNINDNLVLLSVFNKGEIYLYPHYIYDNKHNNGKSFDKKDYNKILYYLLEIIIPIMKKHNISINVLTMNGRYSDGDEESLPDVVSTDILKMCGFKL